MFMLPRLVAFLYGSVPIPILILIAAPVLWFGVGDVDALPSPPFQEMLPREVDFKITVEKRLE